MQFQRSPYCAGLLAAAVLFQTVLAGWGHHHAHPHQGSHFHAHHHRAEHGHTHHHHHLDHDDGGHKPAEPGRVPGFPDEHDCNLCRFLSQSSLAACDAPEVAADELFVAALPLAARLVSFSPVGLHRPRSPPELG